MTVLRYGVARRAPSPYWHMPYSHWPTCPEHSGTPLNWVTGWTYCEGVGWHADSAFQPLTVWAEQ